ncbi:hypothetical protein [Candidatus Enterococcus clewellii]|uniref:Uncharacterized protein n=1 Tax=Candidatus Enterococcus clewellii TaxID=1834193 RepID=A0A242KBC9_9ENTE|nr:hypothetical protein [Enterococcus sp. 9E7_DIV0242]OTP18473.1 hypothetical protein A5888_000287 [Enterococcus sp. 9E7_DIV0242]
MKESYYQGQMKAKQQEIYQIEDELRVKQREIEYLHIFKQEHQKKTAEIEAHFQHRNQRIKQSAVDDVQVKFLRSYQMSMGDLLKENSLHTQRKEEEQQEITHAVQRLEDEIVTLRRQRVIYENQLSELHYQMKMDRGKKVE